MKITILSENAAGTHFYAEHGLSYLIEDDVTILFDTGQSDVFLKNAEKLGLSLYNIDTIVLSHGHFDHGNGLKYLQNKTLICHPDAFIKRYRKKETRNIGLSLNEADLRARFNVNTSKMPFMISPNAFFLGEIPRINNFEAKTTYFVKEDGSEDYVMDDSAIAIKTPKGLVVITGCGHAGICNTIEYAKKITEEENVYAVIGGFHLKKADLVTKKVIEYFKDEKITHIYPSHCTDLPALAEFHNAFKIKQVKTGDIIEL